MLRVTRTPGGGRANYMAGGSRTDDGNKDKDDKDDEEGKPGNDIGKLGHQQKIT